MSDRVPTDGPVLVPLAPIQLYVETSLEGEVDSVVPVRWCVSPGLRDALREKEITDAHVCLVQRRGKSFVSRKVVPLLSEMTYVSFARTGKTDLLGFVVYNNPGQITNRQKGNFIWEIGGTDGQIYDEERWNSAGDKDPKRLAGTDCLTVNVPEEMFAPKPNKVLNWLGNGLFDSEPRDQCHLRRRAIITVLVLPLLAPCALIIGTVIVVGDYLAMSVLTLAFGFMGFRGMTFRPFREPFELGPKGICMGPDKQAWVSRWFYHKQPEHSSDPYWSPFEHPKHPIWWLLSPPVLLFCSFVMFFVFKLIHFGWDGFAGVIQGVVATIIIGILVLGAVYLGTTWWTVTADGRFARKDRQKRRALDKYLVDVNELACNGYRDPRLGSLPRKKRSVSLRYQATKKKVCKPFAK